MNRKKIKKKNQDQPTTDCKAKSLEKCQDFTDSGKSERYLAVYYRPYL